MATARLGQAHLSLRYDDGLRHTFRSYGSGSRRISTGEAKAPGCSLGPFHGRSAICYSRSAKREDQRSALEPENLEN
jgi:hypothetical protein